MNQYDPTEAIFGGVTSLWGRIFMFFMATIIGHGLGMVAAYVMEGDSLYIDLDFSRMAGVPLSFFWQVLQNMIYGAGLFYLLLLVIAFILFAFTEQSLQLLFPGLMILQIWDSFFTQRAVESIPSYYSWVPHFSNWGYALAALFTILAASTVFWPLIPQWLASRKTAEEEEG